MTTRPLAGRHVLAMFVCGFGIIIAVNLTLAFSAVRTFPGLEVANSYVASQSFDARRAAQEALNWDVGVTYDGQVVSLRIVGADGVRLDPSRFTATIGRPTTRTADTPLVFDAEGDARVLLDPGRWRLDLQSAPGDAPFTQSLLLEVAG